MTLSSQHALQRQRVRNDQEIVTECPRCLDDVTAYVVGGCVEVLHCPSGCEQWYTDSQLAVVMQAAKDAAESARISEEFGDE